MEYLGQQYLHERIKANQEFLLKLLNFNIAGYNPIRKWLGIDYKGKIDEISHLSYAYNTEYFKKGNQWYKRQTRVYQQPDLGWKLNILLETIPRFNNKLDFYFLPSLELLTVKSLKNATITYQPSTADATIAIWLVDKSIHGDGSGGAMEVGYDNYDAKQKVCRSLVKWNLTDLLQPTFFDATISLCDSGYSAYATGAQITAYRSLQYNWTESATWTTYDGTNSWTTAGGDYATTNAVSTICSAQGNPPTSGNPPSNYWMNFTSAQNLISDCWYNQNGLVALELRLPNNESGSNAYQWIITKDNTTYPTLRPKLTVTYTVPTTSQISLAFYSNLRFLDETNSITGCALATELEPYKWTKEISHTQTWIKEPTHDNLYIE